MMTKQNYFPPKLATRFGPNRSIWRSCRGFFVEISFFFSKLDFTCLDFMHVSQVSGASPNCKGNPRTNPKDSKVLIFQRLRCPSR